MPAGERPRSGDCVMLEGALLDCSNIARRLRTPPEDILAVVTWFW